jgi:hypothetical protein
VAISNVQICNLALDMAHCRSSISMIGEKSAEGLACARHYEPSLEAVLRAVHWNFARKQVDLSLLKAAVHNPLFQGYAQGGAESCSLPCDVPQPWLFEYAYPSDCLLARGVMPRLRHPQSGPVDVGWDPQQMRAPVSRFIVAQDNDTTGAPIPVLLCNVPQAQLVYTARVSDTNLFDSEFVQGLIGYLASRLCRPLTGDKALAQQLFQESAALIAQAASRNGNEGPTVIDTMPDWIRVRGILADWATVPGAGWLDPQPLTMVI